MPIILLCNSFSDFSCFWEPRQFWGRLIRYFVRCPSVWIYLTFSSCLDSGYLFLGKNIEVKYNSHHIMSSTQAITMTDDVILDHLQKKCGQLSPFFSLFFSLPFLHSSLEESQSVCRYSPHSKVGGVLTPYPWKENISIHYSEFICERDLSLLPWFIYLFSHLFYHYLFYSLLRT